MNQLTLFLILVFSLNILSEVQSGHCDEAGLENKMAVTYTISTAQSSHDIHNGHSQCDHVCHFGHCGHLLLGSSIAFTFEIVATKWPFLQDALISRPPSPLYKPPIA